MRGKEKEGARKRKRDPGGFVVSESTYTRVSRVKMWCTYPATAAYPATGCAAAAAAPYARAATAV